MMSDEERTAREQALQRHMELLRERRAADLRERGCETRTALMSLFNVYGPGVRQTERRAMHTANTLITSVIAPPPVHHETRRISRHSADLMRGRFMENVRR